MKLNQMLMKILAELSSVYVDIAKPNMSIINFRVLYYTFGTSGPTKRPTILEYL